MSRSLPILSLGLLFSASMLTGCSILVDQYQANPIIERQAPQSGLPQCKDYYKKVSASLGHKRVVIDAGSAGFQCRLRHAAASEEARNEFASELIGFSNEICDLHKAAIAANSAGANLVFGTLTTLSAGAAAVTGPYQAPIFAATAAASNATRGLINEEIYVRSLSTSIIKAIEKERNERLVQIRARLAEKLKAYPPSAVQVDVEDYHQHCSFYVGIARVAEALERERPTVPQVDAQLAQAKRVLDGLVGDYLNLQPADLANKTRAQLDNLIRNLPLDQRRAIEEARNAQARLMGQRLEAIPAPALPSQQIEALGLPR